MVKGMHAREGKAKTYKMDFSLCLRENKIKIK